MTSKDMYAHNRAAFRHRGHSAVTAWSHLGHTRQDWLTSFLTNTLSLSGHSGHSVLLKRSVKCKKHYIYKVESVMGWSYDHRDHPFVMPPIMATRARATSLLISLWISPPERQPDQQRQLLPKLRAIGNRH